MKKFLKKALAALFIVVILTISVCEVFAEGQPSKYSKDSNSGERDVICTTLEGTSASKYYTGSNSYSELSELSSGALLSALRALMTDTHDHQTSYSDCRDYGYITDCQNEDGTVILLYTSFAAKQSSFSGSSPGWNREHVWPKSLGGFETSGPGADLHHIRPSNVKTNGTRANKKYGEVSGGSQAFADSLVGTTVSGGTYNSSYFEPHDNVKGDVARICLYVYVRYGSSYSKCSSITNVFSSVDTLLEWCALDPVDTWEMGRNEVVEDIQGNRNVFIDYPELAWLLFDKDIPDDMVTPSGAANGGSSDIPGGDGGSTGDGGNTGDNGDDDIGDWDEGSCSHSDTKITGKIEPTCSTAGYSGDTVCNDCGKTVKLGKATGLADHEYGEPTVITPPTEEAAGEQKLTCENCGDEKTEAIPPIGADADNTDTVVQAAVYASIITILYFT